MTAKKSSPLLIGLLVSVALNGALIGLLVAGGKARGDNPRGLNATNLPDINSIARSLPEEQRASFGKLLTKQERKEIGQAFEALSSSQHELTELLSENSLDEPKVIALMSEIRSNRTELALVSDKALVKFFNTLSLEERQSAITRMRNRRRGGGDNTRGDAPRGDNQQGRGGAMGDGN